MSSYLPKPPPVRGGWRVGLFVFGIAVCLVAGFAFLPLLLPRATPARLPEDATDLAFAPPLALPARGLSPAKQLRFRAPALLPIARLAATNLAPAIGSTRRVNTPTNELSALRGVAGGAWRAAITNRLVNTNELPVFTALRASRGQPIPKEVSDLAKEITRNCQNEAERAKAIYDWMTSHITYDWKVWADMVAGANTYTQPQDPLSVIQRGTGVCAGYAWLFDALAASVGMDATFVIGDVRGYRGTADDNLTSKFQHAWNSVQIDGQWCLLDATWGARQPGESTTDYLARRDYYYQTAPNQLIFDHLPESENWQLLENPIPDDAFRELPNLKPAFFRDGLRLANAFSDTLTTPLGKPTSVILAAPEGILLGATLTQNGQDLSANLSVRESGIRRDILVAPLPAGQYILRLYSKPATSSGLYDCAADYVVNVGGP
ncbi:MAG: transglutaminase domain-containing protein [bacterium]